MKDKRQTDYAILQREYTKKQGMTNVWTRLLTQSATVHKGLLTAVKHVILIQTVYHSRYSL